VIRVHALIVLGSKRIEAQVESLVDEEILGLLMRVENQMGRIVRRKLHLAIINDEFLTGEEWE
jgi:hypothetical protein